MAEKEVKKEKEAKQKKPTKNNELAVKILGVMKTLQANGVEETNSTVLRDKVGVKSRSPIRRALKLLAEEGKVIVSAKKHGKRKQYLYKLSRLA